MKKKYFTSIKPIKALKICCFLLVTCLSVSISSYGQDVKNHLGTSSPGSGNLEIPAGVGMSGNSIKVQTWGAGGGGGGPATLLGLLNVLNVGGGGGGGAFNEGILNNVGEDPDNIKIGYTIGAAGAGGTPTSVDGKNGGKSFFSTISANGGEGGAAGILLGGILNLYASNGIGGQGGQGGSFSGGDGFTAGLLGQGIGLVSGGGGGGAGSGGDGKGSNVDILSQMGGAGGIANGSDGGTGGKGGDGLTISNLTHGNGLAGGFPAGGGGGSITVLDVLGLFGRPTGGDGANGQIKVTYTCPVYTVSNITADNVCVSPGTTVVTLDGFLPIGKYTVTYDVSSPSQTGLQALNVRVTTSGTLKFTVSGLTTVGTSRITIKNITSVDCSTNIDKYVDVTVSPNLTASVSIAASSSGAICYGTPVMFTATPTNGGAAPVYQWRLNGVNIAGANGTTYSSSTLINGDVITCVMTSNASPCLTGSPATSNPIPMEVSVPKVDPVTVCIGGSGSLIVSGTCPSISGSQTASGSGGTSNSTSYGGSGNIDVSINFPALPAGAVVTSVSTTITYTSHSPSWRSELRVQATPPTTFGTTQNDIQVSTLQNAGTITNAVFGTWGTGNPVGTWLFRFKETTNDGDILFGPLDPDANISNISIIVAYTIPGSIDWYTVSSGGTRIGSGDSFNPVGVSGSELANTNTAGVHTFYAACSTSPECRTPVNFIINGVPAVDPVSAPAALCSGATLNPVIPVVNANSPVITEAGWQLETTVGGGDYANLTVPYTVSFADNGKRIRYYVSNSCVTTNSNAVPIIVNSVLTPEIGDPTLPICTQPTATVIATGLSGNWTINATPNVGLTGLTGSGTTATISGLTPGITYSFTFSNENCTSAVFQVVVEELPVKTWKDDAWDGDGIDPTIDEKVIFESDYNIEKSVTACSCEVKSGASVTFNSGYYLKLRNELIVDPDGSLTFENNASLVQINHVENTGFISYKRITTPVNRYDFTYWSSPVVGMTLKQLSPGTFYDKYFKYDNAWVSIVRETGMDIGEGYNVRAPQIIAISGNPARYPAVFKGVPYNDEVKKNLIANQVYLLGNPYPSAISADAFLMANETKLDGTLYFWTHNSPPSEFIDGDKKYNYLANDYATYNGTGGTATRAAIPDAEFNYPNDEINDNIPTGNIAAAQGFFASASENGGEIVFNNSMRLSGDAVMDNSQFFKLGNTSKSSADESINSIEKNRVWLNLTNVQGAFKQTLIGYITGATNDYEGKFDGMTYDGNEYVDFYSVNGGVNLTIQGRALPFQEQDLVALGYKSAIVGEFKISVDHADGVLHSQKVFLEDKLLQTLHDLKDPYSFTTEKGIFNERFVLRYQDKNAVIETTEDTAVETILISTVEKDINVTTSESVINEVYVYDFSGKLVYSDTELNTVATTINNLLIDSAPLIVKVVLENGKETSKKIIY